MAVTSNAAASAASEDKANHLPPLPGGAPPAVTNSIVVPGARHRSAPPAPAANLLNRVTITVLTSSARWPRATVLAGGASGVLQCRLDGFCRVAFPACPRPLCLSRWRA